MLFLFNVHLHILGTDLLNHEIEGFFILANSLTRGGELRHLGVLVSETSNIGFDHIVVWQRV